MAKAGAMTTGLAPSSPPNCILLSLSTPEKLKQHWGRCAPFPGSAVPGSGAGLFDADSAPRFVSRCGLAGRPQGCRNRGQLGSELGDSQAQEDRLFQLLLTSSPRSPAERDHGLSWPWSWRVSGCPVRVGCTNPAHDLRDISPHSNRLSPRFPGGEA